MKTCEHCGVQNKEVEEDRFGNVLCEKCASIVAEEEWND